MLLQNLSSVFDFKSLEFLENLNVPAYKIASLESLHFPLIKEVCKTNKPIIISTGTLSLNEISILVKFLKKNKCKQYILIARLPKWSYLLDMSETLKKRPAGV